jgi:hypothetical protein
MAYDDGVNGMFYLSVLTLICGSFTLAVRFCYRSKCKQFDCCGIKIIRDIETELKEDLNVQQSKSDDKNNS